MDSSAQAGDGGSCGCEVTEHGRCEDFCMEKGYDVMWVACGEMVVHMVGDASRS